MLGCSVNRATVRSMIYQPAPPCPPYLPATASLHSPSQERRSHRPHRAVVRESVESETEINMNTARTLERAAFAAPANIATCANGSLLTSSTCSRRQPSSFLASGRSLSFFAKSAVSTPPRRSVGRWTMMPIGVPKVRLSTHTLCNLPQQPQQQR